MIGIHFLGIVRGQMGRKARRKMSDFLYLICVLHGMLGLLLDVYYCENTIKNYFLEAWECSRALADERFSGDGNILGIALERSPHLDHHGPSQAARLPEGHLPIFFLECT